MVLLPLNSMQPIKNELIECLQRDDLMRASLLVGRVRDSGFDENKYIDTLMGLAAKVWHKSSRVKNNPVAKAEKINQVLFEDLKLEGKSEKYKQIIDDPNRYYVDIVLEKKIASPLILTVIYAILAEQLGIEFETISLASFYFLKVKNGDSDFYIDPFDRGKFLNDEEFHKKFRTTMQKNRMLSANLYEVVASDQLVAKIIQQLKHIYILKNNSVEALRAVELLTAIFPDSPELSRDRGILYCEMEYFSKAMDDLRYYLNERPNADDVGEIKKLTTMLRGYREIMN